MNIFEEVKSRTDMKSVAVHYGCRLEKYGFISCPFHSEKTPSLKLHDNYFHCFGCGAGGTVIDFVMKLFNLSALDAAKKLNEDLSLNIPVYSRSHNKPAVQQPVKKISTSNSVNQNYQPTDEMLRYFRKWQESALHTLEGYYTLLKYRYTEFAPKSPDEEPYSLWVQACQQIPLIEHYRQILIQCNNDECKKLFVYNRKEIEEIEYEYKKCIGE